MMRTSLILAVVCTLLATIPVMTAVAAPKTDRIKIHYDPPGEPEHKELHDYLRERRVLERLQEFLSPFLLPRTLKIEVAECDGEADAFYGDDVITICYEYVIYLWHNKPEKTTPSGIAPSDAVTGPFVDTSLHEFAHAIFDMFDLPVLGPEEDAADLVAAYIYLQLGPVEARRLIMGTAWAFMFEANKKGTPTMTEFADEHGTPAQRAYNVWCIAYGADSRLFDDIVSKGLLPMERAEYCHEEYEQIEDAFEDLISPHIDRALAKKIFKGDWLDEPAKETPH